MKKSKKQAAKKAFLLGLGLMGLDVMQGCATIREDVGTGLFYHNGGIGDTIAYYPCLVPREPKLQSGEDPMTKNSNGRLMEFYSFLLNTYYPQCKEEFIETRKTPKASKQAPLTAQELQVLTDAQTDYENAITERAEGNKEIEKYKAEIAVQEREKAEENRKEAEARERMKRPGDIKIDVKSEIKPEISPKIEQPQYNNNNLVGSGSGELSRGFSVNAGLEGLTIRDQEELCKGGNLEGRAVEVGTLEYDDCVYEPEKAGGLEKIKSSLDNISQKDPYAIILFCGNADERSADKCNKDYRVNNKGLSWDRGYKAADAAYKHLDKKAKGMKMAVFANSTNMNQRTLKIHYIKGK